MAIVYDFGNSASWSFLWSGSETAEPIPHPVFEKYYTIPDVVVPIQLSSPICAVYAESNTDPGTWRFGGTAFYKIGTGITTGGVPDSFVASRKFYLKQINIIRFQRLATSWTLVLRIPYWIRHIDLSVWEYTGLIEDTIETSLEEIKTLLS